MPFRSTAGGFGVPASIRNNNPGAQWPGPVATQFGATGSQRIGGGNLIATFPNPINGAAAHIALLDSRYTGMTLAEAIKKWTGNSSNPSGYIASVSRATGLQPNDLVTHDIFTDPAKAIAFAQAMAGEEAGKSGTLTPDQWKQGYDMAFPGSGQPTVELGTAPARPAGEPLTVNAGDTSRDPGGISQGGDTSLGADTSLGSDIHTEFTGPEYATPNPTATPEPAQQSAADINRTNESTYRDTGSVFDAIPVTDYGAPNAADEWWKQDNWTTGEATASAGAGAGGSIWSDIPAPTAGPTVTINDASAPTITGNASTPGALPTPEPTTGGTIPTRPLPFNDNGVDNTGTELPYPETPPDAAGFDIVNHYDTGGQNPSPGGFGGNLTLGAYLNMPLDLMRYGRDYPPVSGGIVDTSQQRPTTGATQIDPSTGRPFDLSSIPEATGGTSVTPGSNNTYPEIRRGELVSDNSTYPEIRRGELVPDEAGQFSSDPNAGINLNVDFTGGDRYAGTYFDYGTGHYQSYHDPNEASQDMSFAASANQGSEQQAFNPMKFGRHGTGEVGKSLNTLGNLVERGYRPGPSTAAGRARSASLTSIFQPAVQNRGLAQLLTPPRRPPPAGGGG